ncbi:hypothetical protein C7T94_01515 [Pedobacter yulinensis]|uniref:Thioredoxin-like fold domain-containing protein n=1 Tax=Pedobacter yulinensis TaxID=2126353 RepID=A0A2T3HQU2_9SPHI|nr:TlpA disulfide reductase family protein [Pedobacter yulinensis]PST84830.1 hypothetical protein C7T94_01515 [Pedobacter yulinensis]
MKYLSPALRPLLVAALALSSCSPSDARFEIESDHFGPNGTLGIYRQAETRPLAAINLNNAKQEFKLPFAEEGYYLIRTSNGQVRERPGQDSRYFIYLKGGNYKLHADTAFNAPYPVTESDVTEAQELIHFYKISRAKRAVVEAEVARKRQQMDSRVFDDVREAAEEEDRLFRRLDEGNIEAVGEFAAKYPDSKHTPFLLHDLDEAGNFPRLYKKILTGTAPAVQQEKMAQKLLAQAEDALGMEVGARMAAIEGRTPAGGNFDPGKELRKLNLIIVWTSYDNGLRKKHPELIRLYEAYKGKGLQVIGVSLDKNEKWWKSAIDHDRLPWPQYADLKGARSPNAQKLSGMMHPYLFLVNKDGKIVCSKLLPDEAIAEIQRRL